MGLLVELLHRYYNTKDGTILNDLLYELGNTSLWLPIKKTLLEDKQIIPDILRSNNRLYYPLFVSQFDVNDTYRHQHTWVSITLNQAATYVIDRNNLSGIVVNAFTDPFVISRDFLIYQSQKSKSYMVVKGTAFELRQIGDNHEAIRIKESIQLFCKDNQKLNIKHIYVAIFTRENEDSYLVAVDVSKRRFEESFRLLNMTLLKLGQLEFPIDYVLCTKQLTQEFERFDILEIPI